MNLKKVINGSWGRLAPTPLGGSWGWGHRAAEIATLLLAAVVLVLRGVSSVIDWALSKLTP